MSSNPWEKALLLAGAANAESQVMRSHPIEASIGSKKCPRCGHKMEKVKLSAFSDRQVMYCTRDRVVVPIPVTD